jgi:hypothetical protein
MQRTPRDEKACGGERRRDDDRTGLTLGRGAEPCGERRLLLLRERGRLG